MAGFANSEDPDEIKSKNIQICNPLKIRNPQMAALANSVDPDEINSKSVKLF